MLPIHGEHVEWALNHGCPNGVWFQPSVHQYFEILGVLPNKFGLTISLSYVNKRRVTVNEATQCGL
jgi:hypothetical protein